MSGRTFAVGVVGFGRCGSTMTMGMLAAGGCPPVPGSLPVSHELPSPANMRDGLTAGHTVKLLDVPVLQGWDLPSIGWRFVWLDRNPIQQGKSMRKFARWFNGQASSDYAKMMTDTIRADRDTVRGFYASRGPVLDLRYEDVLRDPDVAAAQLGRHVGPPFDVDAAAAVVHDRSPKCRPDMAFELLPVCGQVAA